MYIFYCCYLFNSGEFKVGNWVDYQRTIKNEKNLCNIAFTNINDPDIENMKNFPYLQVLFYLFNV